MVNIDVPAGVWCSPTGQTKPLWGSLSVTSGGEEEIWMCWWFSRATWNETLFQLCDPVSYS